MYDYKSRLAGYRSFDGNGSLVNTVSYTNDPLDRPIAQTSTESGTTTNYTFTYLGVTNALSSETLSGATNSTKRYAFDAFGRRATIADGANRFGYLHDPHGSVSLVVDQAGTVKASYGYTAYGASNAALTKAAAGFGLAVNAYRYTGKRLDAASNTLDMGARRFSRASGRFLQVDSYDGALANVFLSLSRLMGNRYALAGGNPVSYVEVDGHYLVGVDQKGGDAPVEPPAIVRDARGCRDGNEAACERVAEYLPGGDSGSDLGAIQFLSIASDAATGLQRARSAFAAALRDGSRYAAQNIKRTAKLAKRLAPLARGSAPIAVVGVLLEATVAQTAAATAYACIVAVPAAGYWGGKGFGAAFDTVFPQSGAGK